ncbi:uncharacterized protein LACBIDRAFT_296432 [Laccaria bicolor S238N-H82]|uniref:Predicted protein n=1 Tax=Laccaria bicolor (strain S238N-H82 / ATCC MYA-4686) TaxID=486041 RepID=B0D8T2_LACBS|nr:uncharacterized protein LACBIDRAFT_296432 [Laccaria bicolor S238N-H82]EDR09127.1 predicted protein [Laccaria bicolor S238N-H82]|eukprot:XP_001880440.1 predicted protein [Laccaria bicolor S238N-H82]
MTPFQQQANASPSIALERGAYRMRAPSTRTRSSQETTTRPPPPTSIRQGHMHANVNVVLLLGLVAFACIICFGTAYYLFSTSHRTTF